MLVSDVHQSDSVIRLCIFQVVLYNFVCLFLAVLGLCCCARAFSSRAEWGLFSVGYAGFSCCGAQAPGTRSLVAAVCGLTCGSRAQ